MIRPDTTLSAATSTIMVRMMNITFRSTSSAAKEGQIALSPIDATNSWTAQQLLRWSRASSDRVRIFDIDIDADTVVPMLK
jgi:hypothetical protein